MDSCSQITLHKDIHNFDTTHNNDIHAKHINFKTYGSRKLDNRGRNFWNNLPSNKFKGKRKEYIIAENTDSAKTMHFFLLFSNQYWKGEEST